jgi:hypothetical protein
MKVYCKDCKWNYPAWINRCFSISGLEPEPGRVYPHEKIYESANNNNNCPRYDRKWWKVWR